MDVPQAQPDQRLIAWLAFPGQPYRFLGIASTWRRGVGYVAVTLLLVAGAALPLAYFGGTTIGRGLLVDTALMLGMGRPLPAARITAGACRNNAARAGSRVPGQWECAFVIDDAGRRTERVVATIARRDLEPRGAGEVFGGTGVYWAAGVMFARWWNDSILLLVGGGLIGLAAMFLRWARGDRALLALRHGKVVSADLVTWQGRPEFAFIDDGGIRRFARATAACFPLVLDGVRTTGAALMRGSKAVLLDARLGPLDLDPAQRAAILEKAAAVQRQCQVRPALPPRAHDPPTLAGRIERVEQAVAAGAPAEELAGLYDDAWRLVWDSNDADVAERALAARDAIALRMGPAAAHCALLRAREHRPA